MSTKHTVLTFRMPTQIPLGTQCKHAFDFWVRLHINRLIALYSLSGHVDEFVPWCESLFVTDRGIVEPHLN